MVGIIVIFELIELEIKQAASDFCKMRSALSISFSSIMVTIGSRIISVIRNLPSTCSNFPFDWQLKLEKSNFEFSAIDKKVVIKQLLTAAVNKCSGDQIPGMPCGNSGGVATSIHGPLSRMSSGEQIVPFRAVFHATSTL